MSEVEVATRPYATGKRSTRRTFVRRLTKTSAAVFVYAAVRGTGNASAFPYPYYCCDLATHIHCPNCVSGSIFTCPSGWQRHVWFCCQNGILRGCGECNHGPDCFEPPWACSCGYVASGPCPP